MDDVNRPLRRLEIAQRIQELRDRELRERAAVPAPRVDDATGEDVLPTVPAVPTVPPDDTPDDTPADVSPAATIASLLRGGQNWLLDGGPASDR